MDRFLREGSSPLPSWRTLSQAKKLLPDASHSSELTFSPDESGFLNTFNEVEPDMLYCPHHPRNVSWWWKERCQICRNIYECLTVTPGVVLTSDGKSSDDLNIVNSLDFHPDYRFSRWPHISAYSVSVSSLPPQSESGSGIKSLALTKRERRHIKAERKYPQRLPRKGSDTNPSAFTGRVLLIRKEGLSTIGRSLDGAKTANASGQSWKC